MDDVFEGARGDLPTLITHGAGLWIADEKNHAIRFFNFTTNTVVLVAGWVGAGGQGWGGGGGRRAAGRTAA